MLMCFICRAPCSPNDRCPKCKANPYERRLVIKDRIKIRVEALNISEERNRYYIHYSWNGKDFTAIGLTPEAAKISMQDQIFGFIAQGKHCIADNEELDKL